MPNNAFDHQAVDEETIARSQRSGRIAVTVFPLLILAGGVIAFLTPSTFASWSDYVPYGLMLIMFGMGLTLRIPDFALVLKRPLVVLMGVLAQFTIMPLTALLIARVLDLPDQLAAGLILLGCVPGGTASNVVAYLAKGDVALSVTMTSISTLLSPIVTPILTLWLAGQYLPVEAGSMAMSIVQIVVVPIAAGLILRALIPAVVQKVTPLLPWASTLMITFVAIAVVAASSETLATAGLLMFFAVMLHNAAGLIIGHAVASVFRSSVPARRTISIEVGMQNSGLASGLAAQYFTPEAAIAGAIAAVWANITGGVIAAVWGRRDPTQIPVAR